MKGFHYISLYTMGRYSYDRLIEAMKDKFNNGSFYYSLRIVPNKWHQEERYWWHGAIVNNGSGHMKQLTYIQKAMNQKYYGYTNHSDTVDMLDNMFCIARYKFSKKLMV